jgi:alkanesulfonate monooxygenase SsuD/methylene tetrahydromethanopterin reductase-like flavin-dependent oxidoreductase (luciferase family)
MQVGIVLPISHKDGITDSVPTYRDIRDVAIATEAAGFDSLWVFDHLLFRYPDEETTGIHEAWTILTAIAEATERVKLGSIVMCTEFRNPALLAKMAATLDHVSDGRLILGLGCGWHDPEYEAFGYPTDHKVGRFEDSLRIIHSLIREGRSDHQGTYHSASDAVLIPPARADLPILIAAKKPRMLELTARYADAWNLAWFGQPSERLASIRADLETACRTVGRDPATLDITVGITVRYPDLAAPLAPGATPLDAPTTPALSGDARSVADGLAAHAAIGVSHVIAVLEPCTPAAVTRFAEALALFRAES